MAITESRAVVIDATVNEIMDVLLDLDTLTEWSSTHQKVEVLERDEKGRPSKSRQVVKVVGVGDSTRVSFTLTVDPVVPLPGFLVRRGAKGLMETATDGLRKRVMKMTGN